MKLLSKIVCTGFAGLIATQEAGAEPRIVTDIVPVHSLVAGVMAGVGEPELLIDGSQSPHEFRMKPKDARALSSADIVIWVGPEFIPGLMKPIENIARNHQMVLTEVEGVTIRKIAGHDDHDDPDDHDDHDEHDEHDDHEEHHGEDHDNHESHEGHDDHADHSDHAHHDHGAAGSLDPHLWLDPDNLRFWAKAIAFELSEHDPANAKIYQENAESISQQLSALDTKLKLRLSEHEATPFIISHDAMGYFTNHFGLVDPIAVSDHNAASPSPAHLREVLHEIRHEGITCVVQEPQHPSRILTMLAKQEGLNIGEIDILGQDLTPGKDAIFDLLENIALSLESCLHQ